VTANGCLRAPPRRARCNRGEARDIAAGDSTLGLSKAIGERLSMGDQVLLQSGVDYVGGTATLDFGDQPQRRMIVLINAKRLGGESSHLRHIVT
jgi:hypothetical protein